MPTPPPWFPAPNYLSNREAAAAVLDRDGHVIANLVNPADAPLIAAAPLLLAACEEVLREDDRLGGFLSQRAYILLMAAIVKAKGE